MKHMLYLIFILCFSGCHIGRYEPLPNRKPPNKEELKKQKETPPPPTPFESVECNSPLKRQSITCYKNRWLVSYTGLVLYVMGITLEEQTACIKKYHVNMGGCAYKFVAPKYSPLAGPNTESEGTRLCTISFLTSTKCQLAMVYWLNEMSIGGWSCFTDRIRDIEEVEKLLGGNIPSTSEECQEVNDFILD